jgi:hypothetical protein
MKITKIITYLLIVIIFLIILLIIFALITPTKTQKPSYNKTCIEIPNIEGVTYRGCYHEGTGNIYLNTQNKNLLHDDIKIKVSFFDDIKNIHEFNLPERNSSLFKMIPALRRPYFLEISFKSNTIEYCKGSDDLPIGYYIPIEICPLEISEINILDIPTSNITRGLSANKQYIKQRTEQIDEIWETLCKSEWSCEEWGECIDGVQKRKCNDLQECTIPTSILPKVKPCEDICQESWTCKWSECQNGQSTPTCTDYNNCGTTFNKPTQVPCAKECTPDIFCSDWSECSASYNFLTISAQNYSLSGKQRKICTDKNSCISTSVTTRDCSLVIDIYTTTFEKCDKEYIGVYDSLNDHLLVNIEKSTNPNLLNIDLSGDTQNIYCDYCFDGTLNGDETQIDCGGSCPSCTTRKVNTDFSRNIFEKIIDAIANIFN